MKTEQYVSLKKKKEAYKKYCQSYSDSSDLQTEFN